MPLFGGSTTPVNGSLQPQVATLGTAKSSAYIQFQSNPASSLSYAMGVSNTSDGAQQVFHIGSVTSNASSQTFSPVYATSSTGSVVTGTLNVVGGTIRFDDVPLSDLINKIVLDPSGVIPGTYGALCNVPALRISNNGLVTMASNAPFRLADNTSVRFPRTQTLTVTVANNRFVVNGTEAPALTVDIGTTLHFDQSHATNTGFPLLLSVAPNGTHVGAPIYTQHVTQVGTPGTAGAYTEILMTESTPPLFYFSPNKSDMGHYAIMLSIYPTYGNTSNVPMLTLNEEGRIAFVCNVQLVIDNIPNTTVVPGSYGASNAVPTFAFGMDGRTTDAYTSNVTLSNIFNTSNIIGASNLMPVFTVGSNGLITVVGAVPTSIDAIFPSNMSDGTPSTIPTFVVTPEGLIVAASNVPIVLDPSGVIPGTYGGSNTLPVLTFGPDGRILFASNVPIKLPTTGVVPGRYGSTYELPILSLDASGRVTAACNAVAVDYDQFDPKWIGTSNQVPIFTIDATGAIRQTGVTSPQFQIKNALDLYDPTVITTTTTTTVTSTASINTTTTLVRGWSNAQGMVWNCNIQQFAPYSFIKRMNGIAPDATGNVTIQGMPIKVLMGNSNEYASYSPSNLANATIFLITGDAVASNNGLSYIWNTAAQAWFALAPPEVALFDDRYAKTTGASLINGLHMGSNRIVNLPEPIYPQDVATRKYSDAHLTLAFVSSNAPCNVSVGQMWVDVSQNPSVLKYFNTDQTWNNAITVIQSVSGGLISPGTYGNASNFPVIEYGSDRRIVSVSNVPITLDTPSYNSSNVIPGRYGGCNQVMTVRFNPDGRIRQIYEEPLATVFHRPLQGGTTPGSALGSSSAFILYQDGTFWTTNSNEDLKAVQGYLGNPTGTYGDCSNLPIVTVDAKGNVVSIQTVPIQPTVMDSNVVGTYGSCNTVPSFNITSDGRALSASNIDMVFSSIWSSSCNLGRSNAMLMLTLNREGRVAGFAECNLDYPTLPFTVAGTYGNSSNVPMMMLDTYGRILSTTLVPLSIRLQDALDVNANPLTTTNQIQTSANNKSWIWNSNNRLFELTPTVTSFNGRFPNIDGAIDSFTLAMITTGSNAMRLAMSNTADGEVFIVSGDCNASLNTSTYIWSSNAQQWYSMTSPSKSQYDSAFLRVDGLSNMTSNLNMGGFRLTNMDNPLSLTDGATKQYVRAYSGYVWVNDTAPVAPVEGNLWVLNDTTNVNVYVYVNNAWFNTNQLPTTSVIPGTYGSSNQVPVLSVNDQGGLSNMNTSNFQITNPWINTSSNNLIYNAPVALGTSNIAPNAIVTLSKTLQFTSTLIYQNTVIDATTYEVLKNRMWTMQAASPYLRTFASTQKVLAWNASLQGLSYIAASSNNTVDCVPAWYVGTDGLTRSGVSWSAASNVPFAWTMDPNLPTTTDTSSPLLFAMVVEIPSWTQSGCLWSGSDSFSIIAHKYACPGHVSGRNNLLRSASVPLPVGRPVLLSYYIHQSMVRVYVNGNFIGQLKASRSKLTFPGALFALGNEATSPLPSLAWATDLKFGSIALYKNITQKDADILHAKMCKDNGLTYEKGMSLEVTLPNTLVANYDARVAGSIVYMNDTTSATVTSGANVKYWKNQITTTMATTYGTTQMQQLNAAMQPSLTTSGINAQACLQMDIGQTLAEVPKMTELYYENDTLLFVATLLAFSGDSKVVFKCTANGSTFAIIARAAINNVVQLYRAGGQNSDDWATVLTGEGRYETCPVAYVTLNQPFVMGIALEASKGRLVLGGAGAVGNDGVSSVSDVELYPPHQMTTRTPGLLPAMGINGDSEIDASRSGSLRMGQFKHWLRAMSTEELVATVRSAKSNWGL